LSGVGYWHLYVEVVAARFKALAGVSAERQWQDGLDRKSQTKKNRSEDRFFENNPKITWPERLQPAWQRQQPERQRQQAWQRQQPEQQRQPAWRRQQQEQQRRQPALRQQREQQQELQQQVPEQQPVLPSCRKQPGR